MQFDFSGQTAIVVGGTRGIGGAISESFLKSGAKVIATYQSNDQAAGEFKAANENFADRLDLQKFDVTQYGQVESFFRIVEEKHGPFQINGSRRIMRLLDDLLAAFVKQKRMKISGNDYSPCYTVLS
jgi:NAD(P)-dependent dehydrogenase (short-subunit alcohol dehydrogenase family)